MLWWTLRQLKSEDVQTRKRAVERLGNSKDERAIKALIEALKDANLDREAKNALVKIGDVAVEPTIALLANRDPRAASNAADVLGQIGDARAVGPLIAALINLGCCGNAAKALGTIGDARAIEPIIAALKHSNKYSSDDLIVALKQFGDAIEKPLISALIDLDVQVRHKTKGLIKNGDAALQPLIVALSDSDSWVRLKAAEVLGEFGDARAVEPLITILGDSFYMVRESAASALGKIGDARAIEPLISMLKDSDESVRDKASYALKSLKPKDQSQLMAILIALQEWDDIAKLGLEAVHLFITVFREEDIYVRNEIARALLRCSETRVLITIGDAAIEPLIVALTDSHSMVRPSAAKALGQLGGARAIELLIAALNDSGFWTRSYAAEALGQIGDTRAIEPLIIALSDSDHMVRASAASALGQIGTAAVEPLIAALGASETVREKAIEALGEIGDARAVEPLIVALKASSEAIRENVARALCRIGDARSVEPLIAAIKDSNFVACLGYFRDKQAVAPLITALVDPRVNALRRDGSEKAAKELGVLGAASAVGPLITYAFIHSGETIAENGSTPHRVMTAINSLERILEIASADVDTEVLLRIPVLKGVNEIVWCTAPDGCSKETKTEQISCHSIIQLARQELIRRGLKA